VIVVSVASLKAGHSILRTLDGMDIDRPQNGSFSLGQSAGDRDGDQDGLVDSRDNCPDIGNPHQTDMDGDTTGDASDVDLDSDGSSICQDC
jgi:thrombospondin type 3 repeat protein